MQDLSVTTSVGTYVVDSAANSMVFTGLDGTVVSLGLPTAAPAPEITEVDVKESDGSEVVAEPAA